MYKVDHSDSLTICSHFRDSPYSTEFNLLGKDKNDQYLVLRKTSGWVPLAHFLKGRTQKNIITKYFLSHATQSQNIISNRESEEPSQLIRTIDLDPYIDEEDLSSSPTHTEAADLSDSEEARSETGSDGSDTVSDSTDSTPSRSPTSTPRARAGSILNISYRKAIARVDLTRHKIIHLGFSSEGNGMSGCIEKETIDDIRQLDGSIKPVKGFEYSLFHLSLDD